MKHYRAAGAIMEPMRGCHEGVTRCYGSVAAAMVHHRVVRASSVLQEMVATMLLLQPKARRRCCHDRCVASSPAFCCELTDDVIATSESCGRCKRATHACGQQGCRVAAYLMVGGAPERRGDVRMEAMAWSCYQRIKRPTSYYQPKSTTSQATDHCL